ncbi:helix-turn-helix domain-containing protein [Vibrio lentus]
MDEQLSLEICKLLKRELKRCNISYRTLATELEISEVSIKRLLNSSQPLSIQRLVTIANLTGRPLSKLLAEAEENVASIPVFSKEQDDAFFDNPALFSFWSELAEDISVQHIQEKHRLNDPSVHLYLRQLEKLSLIHIGFNNACKLLLPKETAFIKGARYPVYFTSQVFSGLQERVINLPESDDDAFLTSFKAELTKDEFIEINNMLDNWLFNKLRERQAFDGRSYDEVKPYTFGFMGAQGEFHGQMPAISNLV